MKGSGFAGCLILIVVLGGCKAGEFGGWGDSGGNSTMAAPAAPALNLDVSTKQLKFSWDDVPGATHYQLLENPDGASGFTQVGTNIPAPGHTLDIAVHRRDWVNGSFMVKACNAVACVASNEVNTLKTALQAIGYFKASNTEANDHFGAALALSADGNTLAVGAPWEASNATGVGGDQGDNTASFAGAVYVLTRSGSGWVQEAYVKASNAGTNDFFGAALALSADGNTLAVGAPEEDSGATGPGGNQHNNLVPEAGAVYVFTRSGGAWTQQAYLKAANTGKGDRFGSALGLSNNGNMLAVGAPGEDSGAAGVSGNPLDDSEDDAGAVYIFDRMGGTWTQQAYLKASNTGGGDQFGSALGLSSDGNTLAVGAFGEDSGTVSAQNDAGAAEAGAVYVFARTASTWAQQAYVKASNIGADDRFGDALTLSGDGDTLAVGAYGEDSAASGVGGDESSNAAASAGAAYVFTRSGGAWTQQAYVKASNAQAGDRFGDALALNADGSMLAVGAPEEDGTATGVNGQQDDNSSAAAGAAYMFARSGSGWNPLAYVKAGNTGAGDRFGTALALSADGNTAAVAASEEDSRATGVGADQSDNSADKAGALYLY